MARQRRIPENDPARLVYSVTEVARVLGIGRDHAYKQIKAGVIPSVKLANRIMVPKASLEAWLAQGQ